MHHGNAPTAHESSQVATLKMGDLSSPHRSQLITSPLSGQFDARDEVKQFVLTYDRDKSVSSILLLIIWLCCL
jgi:hypothetical protein